MSAQPILSRLQRVRQTGRDRWIASCPTREDRRPSLSIRELPDGRVLMHDFGGDSVEAILAAIDLDFSALFPEKSFRNGFNHHRTERRPFNAHDALQAVALEVTVVRLCAASMRDGMALSDEDDARLSLAFTRIVAAETLINAR